MLSTPADESIANRAHWAGLPAPAAARSGPPQGRRQDACTRPRCASRRDTSPAPPPPCVMTSGRHSRHLSLAEVRRLGESRRVRECGECRECRRCHADPTAAGGCGVLQQPEPEHGGTQYPQQTGVQCPVLWNGNSREASRTSTRQAKCL